MLHDLVVISSLCFAVGSCCATIIRIFRPGRAGHVPAGGRAVALAHGAAYAAMGLLGLWVAIGLARNVLGLPHDDIQRIDWLAVGATACAAAVALWDRTARFPLAACYALGFTWLSMTQLARDLSTARFLIWTAMAEWAGFLLTSAVVGWLLSRIGPAVARLRIPNDEGRWSRRWFLWAQAVLAAIIALTTVWIAIDFSFDGMAQGTALFGLVGRTSTCATALMLLGAAIVMAWQSTGFWRAGWQYWAIAAGLMFTTSVSWARIGADAETPWVSRSLYLAISSGMLSLMTRIGFPVALPRTTDWIPRGRRAAPFLAALSLLLFGFLLIRSML